MVPAHEPEMAGITDAAIVFISSKEWEPDEAFFLNSFNLFFSFSTTLVGGRSLPYTLKVSSVVSGRAESDMELSEGECGSSLIM
jgi:hypothetical protein